MITLQQTITLVNDSVPPAKADWQMLKSLPLDDLINQVCSSAVKLAINVAVAVVVFYVGKFIINKLYALASSILTRRKVDRSLTSFLLSMIRIALYFILIVTVIGILGIETSSFIAIFASAGVAVGMALSGTLQNFAGGVLILLLKPYKVGDYIETQGYAGYVTEIQIFHTIICTYDNKSIIIPNGGLSTGSINNWSREDYRRLEWPVSISYGDDFEATKAALLAIIADEADVVKQYIEDDREAHADERPKNEETKDEEGDCDDADPDCDKKPSWLRRILHHHKKVAEKVAEVRAKRATAAEPEPKTDRSPSVVLDQLGASSVDLKMRAWVRSSQYWPVYYRVNQRIYSELPRPGITFPFPQLDVHINPAANTDQQ